MPQPKNLQKLARARMARTGESYTTARQAILRGDPEPGTTAPPASAGRGGAGGIGTAHPPGPGGVTGVDAGHEGHAAGPVDEPELPEYPAPGHVTQYDAGLWHRVLTQAGITHPVTGTPLSEALLAGLAGGIGFMVFTFEYEAVTTATLLTRAHPEPYTANLLARCGAGVLEQGTGSAKAAAANLDAGLDAGRAVVVRVARAALPWIDADAVEEADTLDVAIVGEHGADLLLDDGSGELLPIPPRALAAARGRVRKERHWQAWVPSTASPDARTLAANVRDAVVQTTGRLLGTAPLEGIPAHFAKNFGVAGMRSWAERLRDTTTRRGWTRIFEDPERLRYALEQLDGFMHDARFGGDGALRGLYADFLEEAAALPGRAALAACAPAYRELAGQWDALRDALDTDTDPGQRSSLFANLAERVAGIADAEEAAARALADAVGANGPAAH